MNPKDATDRVWGRITANHPGSETANFVPFVTYGQLRTPTTKASPVKTYSMKEAYEANKTSQKCVVCGSPTYNKVCFSSTIQYCDCVDKLLE